MSSTPTNYNSNKAIQEAEARRAERVRMNNAARNAAAAQERAAQAPRKNAKARAEEAAIVAIESLGVHDPLPGFDSVRTARENIHKAVVGTFQSMTRALDSSYLDGPQGVMQVAKIGREALGKHADTLNSLRTNLQRTRGDVEQRLQAAMTPPAHLTRVVEQTRDALRSMSPKQQEEVIKNARGEDSIILLYAIGGAPSFLTGVQEGLRMEKRATLLGLRDPELLTLEPNLPKAFAAVEKMEAGINSLINSVVDFDASDALAELRRG